MVWRPGLLALAALTAMGPGTPALSSGSALQDTTTRVFAIELNGVLCGYSEITPSWVRLEGRDAVQIDQTLFLMVSALGSEFNSTIRMRYHVDPVSEKFCSFSSDVQQGPTHVSSELQIRGDSAIMHSSLHPEPVVTALPPDIVLETPITSPHLVRDFIGSDLIERVYNVLDVRECSVHLKRYVRVDSTSFEFEDRECGALVFDELDLTNGVKARLWVDPSTGEALRVEIGGGSRILTRSTRAVAKRIKTATLDNNIFTKTNVAIADIPAISFMKVRAILEPTGLWVTEEGLNVPGQRFEGTVEENLIDGIFEIDHPRYDGRGAPAFPRTLPTESALKAYLGSDQYLQADDPVLRARARELTAGARDSWEAACRISRWVADSIVYAIPGGGSARATYDTRSGECGAHSLLVAAFCRAVGIPARVVWGCMYTPNRGGSFGQHGWSEVHMGEAGWIPLDATAGETDFVDSGHLRIGELASASIAINAKKVQILDYRAGTHTMTGVQETAGEEHRPYLGTYALKEAGLKLTVSLKGGQLAAEIPGKLVFALHEPDEAGRWESTVSDRLYCTFEREPGRRAQSISLHELLLLPRSAGTASLAEDVPKKFVPYLGSYRLAMRNAEFRVHYKDRSLAVDDPLSGKTVHLRLPDESGAWVDEFGKHSITFQRNEEGAVTAMTIDAATVFSRVQ